MKNQEVEKYFVIPPKFDDANSFSEDLAAVKVGEKWGFIDKKGNILFKTDFEMYSDFFNDIAIISINVDDPKSFNRYFCGYINKKGNVLINPTFENAGSFNEGFAAVKYKGKWGFIRNPALEQP